MALSPNPPAKKNCEVSGSFIHNAGLHARARARAGRFPGGVGRVSAPRGSASAAPSFAAAPARHALLWRAGNKGAECCVDNRPSTISWERRDVLLYAVGIGTRDLRFVYENHPCARPGLALSLGFRLPA